MEPQVELGEEEKAYISELFFEKMVPKLKKLQARIGTITCDFAGEEYRNWIIHFRPLGDDFEIVEFEYDPDARSLKLPI